jgi:hypothetical protein
MQAIELFTVTQAFMAFGAALGALVVLVAAGEAARWVLASLGRVREQRRRRRVGRPARSWRGS